MCTGREWDAESRLYQYRFRYLEPRSGRFLTRDPLGAWADPANLGNPYAYVGNSPWDTVDPFGLRSGDPLPRVPDCRTQLTTGWTPRAGDWAIAAHADEPFARQVRGWVETGAAFYDGIALGVDWSDAYDRCDVSNQWGEWLGEEVAVSLILSGLGPPVQAALGPLARLAAKPFQRLAHYLEDLRRARQARAALRLGDEMVGGFDDLARAGGAICFAAGTLVATEEGLRPIEDIAVGHRVWSWDEETGEVGLQAVIRTFEREVETLLEVTVRLRENPEAAGVEHTEVIRVTAEHPFWVIGLGWMEARALKGGDTILALSAADNNVRVGSIVTCQDHVTVYNLEVEGTHTYAVTRCGLPVHNHCGNFRFLHDLDTLRRNPGYEYWRGRPTREILESLRPGSEAPLRVNPDTMLIWDGNTRLTVLLERGEDISRLPFETYRPLPLDKF